MPRYRVTLAYDGTDFQGWQLQSPQQGTRTVQGELEAALGRLVGGRRVVVAGAGRTDAGVHAEGQVASFDLPQELPTERLVRALNGLLPGDVRALEAGAVPPDFHARRDAWGKLYRYQLDTGPVQLPTRRRTAGHVRSALDLSLVEAASRLLLGRRDFAALASSGGSAVTTVRTVRRLEVRRDESGLVFEVEADGFLRKMVRSMVGGLVAVGRGAVGLEGLRSALEAGDRRAWPAPAEARGLFLVRVDYPPEALG
jgi:tRNA pseudouridine38-40 synthase